MTTISSILKYQVASTFLSVGDQPFKTKAKFTQISKWKYIDKLNKIKEFSWTVPNDEFTRANSLLERKAFVPFIKPFRGVVCERATNESTIDLKACEFAWHFTRRVFRQNGNARISYGSPLAYIQFEEDVLDSIGTSHGTITGTESYDFGQIEKAFTFDGSTRINLANESLFDFDITDKFTLSFWSRSNNSGTEILVAKRTDIGSSDVGYAVYLDTSGVPHFEISNGTTEYVVDGTTNLRDNRYHLITVRFNGNSNQNGMDIIIDKVIEGTGASLAMTGSILNNLTFSIGAGNAGLNALTGRICDIRIYPRTISDDIIKDLFELRRNPSRNREYKTTTASNLIAQDILDHANTDMPAGVTWTLDPAFPTDDIVVEYNFDFNFDALSVIAEHLGKDLNFDNERFIVKIETKGKTLSSDEKLDIIITSQPKISTDKFANQITMLGKKTDIGEQLERQITTPTVLQFTYEKVVSDNKLNSQEQLIGVGNALLDEFKRLTPSIKGEIPFSQFVRLNLESGDRIPISQPQKQLNGTFRVMEIRVTENKAKLTLESIETGILRLRSQSLSDVIGGILDRIQDQSIET